MTQLRACLIATATACACTDAGSTRAQLSKILEPLLASSAESQLDPTTVQGSAPGPQLAPAISARGSSYLVAWEDGRRFGDTDVYGVPLNVSGQPIGAPFPIATGTGDQVGPSIACNGPAAVCFAAWEDKATGLVTGMPLDFQTGRPIAGNNARALVSTDGGTQGAPYLAAISTGFLLAFESRRGTRQEINATFLTPLGFATSTLPLDTSGLQGKNPSIAVGPDDALVVWEQGPANIAGMRISVMNGRAIDSAPLRLNGASAGAAGATQPTAAWTPYGSYRVVWADSRLGNYDIYTTLLAVDGGVSLEVPLVTATADQLKPVIGPNPSGNLVVWADHRSGESNLYGTLVGATTAFATSPIIMNAGDQTGPAMVSESGAVLVWRDDRALDGQSDIYAATLGPMPAQSTSSTPLSTAAADQGPVRAAVGAGTYLAAWDDTRNVGKGTDLFAAALDSTGSPLDAGFVLASAAGAQGQVAIGARPADYLIVWADALSPTLKGRRWSPSTGLGALTSLSVASTTPAQAFDPAVAWDGLRYWFLAYVEGSNSGATRTLYVTRFDPTGMAAPGLPVIGKGGLPSTPAVSVLNNTVLVVWSEKGAATGSDIYATRYDATGGGANDLTPIVVCSASDEQTEPTVTHDKDNFLVVWQDARPSAPLNTDIYAARVTPVGGQVLDPDGIRISVGMGPQVHPTAAWDGRDFVIAWEDHRDLTTAHIWGTRVRPSDLAHQPEELLTPIAGLSPSLALDESSTGILVYHRTDPALGERAFVKPLLVRPGGPCASHGQCQTGQCVSGTCAELDGGWLGGDAGGGGVDGGTDAGVQKPIIHRDATLTATVGKPYVYNALGRVTLEQGTPPVTFDACGALTGFRVEPRSGAVTWVPSTSGVVMACVSASNASRITDTYAFSVDVAADPSTAPLSAAFALTLDGSAPPPSRASFDGAGMPADLIVAMRWDFGDMSPYATGVKAQHDYLLPGGYQAELTVFDASGRTATARQPVRVPDAKGHVPPLAVITASALEGKGSLPVDFSCDCAEGSAPIVHIEFDYGEHATFGPGTYRVRVRAIDENGLIGMDSVMIRVDESDGSHPPDCHASVDPTAGFAPFNALFGAEYSDPESAVSSAMMSFDDGTSVPVGASLPRFLTSPGRFRADLVVSDGKLTCHDWVEAVSLTATNATPPLLWADPPEAECGKSYSFTPGVVGDGPYAFRALVSPSGASTDTGTGTVQWDVPASFAEGDVPVRLEVQTPAGTATWDGVIAVTCPASEEPLRFGTPPCGCGSTSQPLTAFALLAALWALSRRRACS